MASNFQTKKTSKENESKWVENYQYYFKKPINKDGSKRYICSGCTASITILNDEIIKINGNLVKDYSSILIKESHKENHEPVSVKKIFEIDFKLSMKAGIKLQPDKPVGQVYQEQQNKIIEDVGTLLVACLVKSNPEILIKKCTHILAKLSHGSIC